MKISWSHGAHVACFGKIVFIDGEYDDVEWEVTE